MLTASFGGSGEGDRRCAKSTCGSTRRATAGASCRAGAWLSGYLGCFWEDGIKYGPANPHAQRWDTPADEQEAEPAIPDLAFFADLWPRYPVSLENADLTAAELPAAGRDDARDQPVSPASATCRPPQAGAALPSGTVS